MVMCSCKMILYSYLIAYHSLYEFEDDYYKNKKLLK